MRFIPASAIIAAICASASIGAAQQQSVQLETGARVRLVSQKLPANDRIVRVVAAGGDTVTFRSERSSVMRTLPLSDIEAVEVSLGQRSQVRRSAAIGLLTGVGIGVALGLATYEPCEGLCFGPSSRGESAAFVGMGGGVLGLLIGTAIGAVNKAENWQRVQPNTKVGLLPSAGGAGVSISYAFR